MFPPRRMYSELALKVRESRKRDSTWANYRKLYFSLWPMSDPWISFTEYTCLTSEDNDPNEKNGSIVSRV